MAKSCRKNSNCKMFFFTKYDFINCIAVADGMLFPLTQAPQSDDAPDYQHGRKYQYSLSVMIVNDDNKEIRYYFADYPGSAYDNQVNKNLIYSGKLLYTLKITFYWQIMQFPFHLQLLHHLSVYEDMF